MTNQHPITPPPELVQDWAQKAQLLTGDDPVAFAELLCAKAARWGADQQLEHCVDWLDGYERDGWAAEQMRNGCRPKPPNLKAQALAALSRADKDALTNPLTGEVVALRTILSKEQANTIRRALEALPND